MSSIKGTARYTGILYLLMGLPGPFILLYLPHRFLIPGDATATAQSISTGELVYRLGILSGLISSVAFLFLVSSLYKLLEDVDREQARLMVLFVVLAVAVGMIDLVLLSAPLVLLNGANFLSAFSKPQLDALAFGFLKLRGSEVGVASAFWGLWLLPFGVLVYRSGFIPKFIGVMLVVGCFAYLTGSVTSIVFPHYLAAVSRYTLPLAGPGEILIMLWLVIKGGNVPLPGARSTRTSGVPAQLA